MAGGLLRWPLYPLIRNNAHPPAMLAAKHSRLPARPIPAFLPNATAGKSRSTAPAAQHAGGESPTVNMAVEAAAAAEQSRGEAKPPMPPLTAHHG